METLVTIVKRANGNLFDLETTLHASWHTTTARSPAHPLSQAHNLAFARLER